MQNFIQKFTNKKINFVKIDGDFYLSNPEFQKLNVPDDLTPQFIGLFLGSYDEEGVFEPSCALLDWIAKSSKLKIFVDSKAEWLFLCERDIFGQGIVKSNIDDNKFRNKMVLVQNEHDENLGIGRVIDSFSKKQTAVVKNILDKGIFLRKER